MFVSVDLQAKTRECYVSLKKPPSQQTIIGVARYVLVTLIDEDGNSRCMSIAHCDHVSRSLGLTISTQQLPMTATKSQEL